jgi:hypothetical protein
MKRLLKGMVAVVLLFSLSTSVLAAETSKESIDNPCDGKELETISGSAIALKNEDGTTTYNTYSDSHLVTVKVTNPVAQTPDTVYSVDVTWGVLAFEYKYDDADNKVTWSPADHAYKVGDDKVSGNWTSATSAAITVTNHSNEQVQVSTFFENNNALTMTNNGVDATITSTVTNNAGTDKIVSTVVTETGETTSDTVEKTTTTTTNVSNGTSNAYVLRTAEGTPTDAAPTVTSTVQVSGTPTVTSTTTNTSNTTIFEVGIVCLKISAVNQNTDQTTK